MAPGETEARKTEGILCPGAAWHPALAFLGETKPLQLRGFAAFSLAAAAAWSPVWDLGDSPRLLPPPQGVLCQVTLPCLSLPTCEPGPQHPH